MMGSDPNQQTLQPYDGQMRHISKDDASSATVHPSHAPSVAASQVEVDGAAAEKERVSVSSMRNEVPVVDMEKNAGEKRADRFEEEEEDESTYPHGVKLWLISLALSLAVFVVALVSCTLEYDLVILYNPWRMRWVW